MRVLISTAGTNTWVVASQVCGKPGSAPDCVSARGQTFNVNASTSWKQNGGFRLGPNEWNLGYNAPAVFGLDSLSLGESNATGGPTLSNQTVALMGTNSFYIGSFGLSNQPTNFTSLSNSEPSFLTSLRSKGLMPSVSWGYTAGAAYRMLHACPLS